MKKIAAAWLIFAFFFISASFAGEIIKAEVDKLKAATDEEIIYKLNIILEKNTRSNPQLPDFKGFKVISQAQSTTVSFQEGQSDILMTHVYILIPVAAGKFTIGPSSIKVDGKVYSTSSFEIEVTQSKKPPRPEPDQESDEDGSDAEAPEFTL